MAAVAAVVVVLVTTPVTRKQGIWYALISLAFIVSFEFWRRSLALDDPPQVDIGVGYGIKSGLMFIILLACFMRLIQKYAHTSHPPTRQRPHHSGNLEDK